jgi:hypothetical protein
VVVPGLSEATTTGGIPMAQLGGGLRMSWVAIERIARERAGAPGARGGRPYRDDAERLSGEQLMGKLRDLGLNLDRAALETVCQDAVSAQEVAEGLLPPSQRHTTESDWAWLAILTLWQRWWPAKLCLETIDDRMQAGYVEYQRDSGAATDVWLGVWADVLALCDREGIITVEAFDDRFVITQSLFNWNQDLEQELGNAGLHDPAKLRARIDVGEEFLRRFDDVDDLTAENWRRAIGEAWFWLGETATADELFRQWLESDPQWGYGWIGWASGYLPQPSIQVPADHRRAEELLCQGLAVNGVRDPDAVSQWLRDAREESL